MSRQSRVLEAIRDGTVGTRSIRAVCPFCERKGYTGRKKNLDFDKARGWWLCWRCNSRGKIDGWEISNEAANLEPSEVTTFDPPKSFISIGTEHGAKSFLTYGSRTYAEKRGIAKPVWSAAKPSIRKHTAKACRSICASGLYEHTKKSAPHVWDTLRQRIRADARRLQSQTCRKAGDHRKHPCVVLPAPLRRVKKGQKL